MITNTMNILPKMRRRALKRRDNRYYQTFEITTKKYNNWIIAIDYFKRDPSWVTFCTYVNSDGFNAVMVCNSSSSLIHYSGHFFERYNERFLKNELNSKSDILKEFILRNTISQFQFPYNDERFTGVTHDGVVLGYLEDGINWFNCKTFITEDMLFNNQQATIDMASTHYQKYWNEVHGKTVIPEYYSCHTKQKLNT